MILTLADVISEAGHERNLALVASSRFVDGRETAGEHLAEVKRNTRIARGEDAIQAITEVVLGALKHHQPCLDATYPQHLHSVLVSRCLPGMGFGAHVDSALMGTHTLWRTDLSLTLFLNAPEDYEGGELCLESGSGSLRFKLPKRHMLCYPTSDLRQVKEVTRGERLVVVGWVQSTCATSAPARCCGIWPRHAPTSWDAKASQRAFDLVNKAHTNLLRRWSEP